MKVPVPEIVATRCIQQLIGRALEEDIGPGDVTSEALVPDAQQARAYIAAKGRCVLAGNPVAASVLLRVDPSLEVEQLAHDGDTVEAGRRVLSVAGRARAILAGERTALNFLQRLSGIATLARRCVDQAAPAGVTVLDTRKTTPGMRLMEKYAVRCGGAANHRMGLYDRVMIKDNHLAVWRAQGNSVADAVRTSRAMYPGLLIEVEVDSVAQLRDALDGGPDWVLLDNMTPDRIRECVALGRGRCKIEVSGGVSPENLGAVAMTGVDAVSLGALTHSAPAADFSLEIEFAAP
jgi:nicotinate-nucleotide pyrophosphorylase (carboxylating)